jgi:hypothetical protein
MTRLNDALRKFIATDFGDAIAPTTSADEGLREDLRNVMKTNSTYANIYVGMILLLFLGAFVLVVMNLKDPTRISVIFGITGISFAALMKQMMGLWREKERTAAAYALAAKLPPEDLKSIITILLQVN